VAVLVLLSLSVRLEAAWYDVSWSYRKAVTISFTNVSANLTNFTVLISRTDSQLQGNAQTNGVSFTHRDSARRRRPTTGQVGECADECGLDGGPVVGEHIWDLFVIPGGGPF
jgi:hypothetical protein